MRLDELGPNRAAVISDFALDQHDEQRLREHGFDEGVEVELRHRAAFGSDPIAVRVGNALVAIRRVHAAGVMVEPV